MNMLFYNLHRLSKSIIIVCLISGFIFSVEARQFRLFKSIATPETSATNLPEGAVEAKQLQPLDREFVDKAVKDAIAQWNTPGMAETLAQEFYDSSRLTDAMSTIVPKDASLRVQSVQGIQTVEQYLMPDPDGGRGELVSIVSVTVRTQLEFNSPSTGFVRFPGVNEFILEVSQPAPP